DGEVIGYTVTTGTGSVSPSTATTTDGVATITYTASGTVGTVMIRAQATNGVNASVEVTLIGAQVGSVSVSAGAASIVADGSSQVLISATVRDANNNTVADGTTVTFTTTAGDLDSGSAGTQATFNSFTSGGIATVMLTSPTTKGKATVSATAGGVSGSVTVEFEPGAPAKIKVTASPANLTADGSSTSEIRVTVLDAKDNPVSDGETLTFEATEGTLANLTMTTTDGVATNTYTAPSSVPTAGHATVTVRTAADIPDGTVNITLIGPQIAGITLAANPTSLPADGTSQATISANVTVAGGDPVPDGTTVTFSLSPDDPASGSITAEATTGGGIAIATLTSSTTAGSVTIRAEAGGRRAQTNVEYTPGSISVNAVPNSLLGTGLEEATLTVTIAKANGDPLTGGEITFALSDQSLGTIGEVTETGEPGRYTAVFSAAAKGGTVTVTATATIDGTDVSGSDTVEIEPPPAFIEVTEGFPQPVAIAIKGTGGQSTSQVVFDVKDIQGNLVADGYRVDFSILTAPEGGEEISPLFAYTASGKVGTVLRSGYKSGPVSIKAIYFHDTSVSTTTSQIAISGGPPVGEEFGITAEYRNISGLWKAYLDDGITLSAGDVYGNPVPDGTAISFKTYNTGGLLEPGSSTTEGGIVRSTLKSVPGAETTPAQGFVSVTGEAVNGGRTAHVTSIAVVPDGIGDIVYIGTNGGGVYKSTDGGASWTNISRSSEDSNRGRNFIMPYVKGPRSIAVDPDDYNTIYVGTGYFGQGNVYRSLDGGANWNSNNNEEVFGLFSGSSAVLAVVCDDGGSDYVWIGTEGQGAFLSEDGERFKVGGEIENLVFNGVGTGSMSTPELSPTSRTESFTVTYVMPADQSASQPEADPDNVGDGLITSVETDRTKTLSETWTIRVMGNPGSGSEEWEVRGSVAGVQSNEAITDTQYVSDDGEVRFTIIPGTTDFGLGDSFTFTTTSASPPFWRVEGSVSGVQQNVARTDLTYRSDNREVEFLISTGTVDFDEGDRFTFDVVSSGLGHGRTVRDIVKAPESGIGNSAVLYAATPTGVFRSTDGGKRWAVTKRFTGDNIRCLAIHPNSNGGGGDIIYAGTQEAGVWVSTDSGGTWTNYVDGLGKGSSASNPVADTANKGNGVMSKVTVGPEAKSEYWTVTFDEAQDKWKVVGTVSGAQAAAASTGLTYTSGGGEISFKITAGTVPFEDGDFYYFITTRDPGREIRSVLVVTDGINNSNDYLYATTYFWGALAPHAVGNVYAHPLNDGTGHMQGGATWVEAAEGLPQYDPPDDQTLFAQHILAANTDIAPTTIFIGGEGINFYKAAGEAPPASGFYSAEPLWVQSKTGLSNLVMTRMLVLFSGMCDMTISENPAYAPAYIYTVYIQDRNGNPPVAGTAFKVETFDVDDKLISTPIDIVYPDALTYKGTFRDPSNPSTNNPYQISVTYSPGGIARTVFTYTPTCLDEAPGCSGSKEVVEFNR
ncbi:MAG TPA: hypothetical protein ENN79_15975, partial [Desulfobacteraceae bacterium]|nr:hypothetical protein [Desulfobacteraceae bacterium]